MAQTAGAASLIWGVGLAMIILPYLVQPSHFGGSWYRLFLSLHILALYPLLSIHFNRVGQFATRSVLLSVMTLMAAYSAVFLVTFTLGLHEAPFAGSQDYTFPGFSNIRQPSFMIAPLSVAALVLAAGQTRYDRMWIGLIACAVILWCLVLWSGSRGGFMAGLVGLACEAILSKTHRAGFVQATAIVVPLAFALAYMLPPGEYGLNLNRIVGFLRDTPAAANLSPGRVEVWKFAIDRIGEHPILGHGLGAFPGPEGTEFRQTIVHAHNGYLDVAHAGGLVAMIAITGWIATVYARLMYHVYASTDTVLIATFAALSVMLSFALIDAVFFNYKPLMLAVILFAIAQSHLRLAGKGQR